MLNTLLCLPLKIKVVSSRQFQESFKELYCEILVIPYLLYMHLNYSMITQPSLHLYIFCYCSHSSSCKINFLFEFWTWVTLFISLVLPCKCPFWPILLAWCNDMEKLVPERQDLSLLKGKYWLSKTALAKWDKCPHIISL